MKHCDFKIGSTFRCGAKTWRCTDIGTRTIVAIRTDSVEVGSNVPPYRRTLSGAEAEAEGWFNGPPYAVREKVFDEYEQMACAPEADAGDSV
jgi:hypothetical protein